MGRKKKEVVNKVDTTESAKKVENTDSIDSVEKAEKIDSVEKAENVEDTKTAETENKEPESEKPEEVIEMEKNNDNVELVDVDSPNDPEEVDEAEELDEDEPNNLTEDELPDSETLKEFMDRIIGNNKEKNKDNDVDESNLKRKERPKSGIDALVYDFINFSLPVKFFCMFGLLFIILFVISICMLSMPAKGGIVIDKEFILNLEDTAYDVASEESTFMCINYTPVYTQDGYKQYEVRFKDLNRNLYFTAVVDYQEVDEYENIQKDTKYKGTVNYLYAVDAFEDILKDVESEERESRIIDILNSKSELSVFGDVCTINFMYGNNVEDYNYDNISNKLQNNISLMIEQVSDKKNDVLKNVPVTGGSSAEGESTDEK